MFLDLKDAKRPTVVQAQINSKKFYGLCYQGSQTRLATWIPALLFLHL